ncbi:hypothetical protein [Fibrobacter sp.]
MVEKNDTGDWNQVGYTGPGNRSTTALYHSANFDYSGAKGTWQATNTVKLNECVIGGIWGLTATLNDANNNAQGQSSMTLTVAADGKNGVCLGLTPSFASLTENYK